MTIKFTKTGIASEENDESLLFEFLDHECPEKIVLDYQNDLVTTQYIGSLQSSQMNGIYLQPIEWEGEFFGDVVSDDGYVISAKERFDQLFRLNGRVIKFWYEGIKQIVLIKSIVLTLNNYQSIEYKIVLQPHDLQVAIKPTEVESFKQKAFLLSETDTSAKDATQGKLVDGNPQKFEFANGSPFSARTRQAIKAVNLEPPKSLSGRRNDLSTISGIQDQVKENEFYIDGFKKLSKEQQDQFKPALDDLIQDNKDYGDKIQELYKIQTSASNYKEKAMKSSSKRSERTE